MERMLTSEFVTRMQRIIEAQGDIECDVEMIERPGELTITVTVSAGSQ